MPDYGPANTKTERSMSRIDNDVAVVKRMAERVEGITERPMRHAHSLGYFEESKAGNTSTPSPVITTLADALQALERAIDNCSGSLNVFD